jgi:hypothetical protein
MAAIMKNSTSNDSPGSSSTQTMRHLDEVLNSSAFASSKRCQEFLRYVVCATVEGRAGSIKERTIALEVFGKGIQFEPSEDSLVRVKAREVRKRLAEYYESKPNSQLRIDMPVGGYVPQIVTDIMPVVSVNSVPAKVVAGEKHFDRRRALWLMGGALGVLGGASLARTIYRRNDPLGMLWEPVFATKKPLLIFSPLLPTPTGEMTDRVGMGTSVAVSRASEFLTKKDYSYSLRYGADLTFAQLREQPSLLLGGFSSEWSQRLFKNLRFKLLAVGTSPGSYVFDAQKNQQLGDTVITKNGFTDHDFAILARLFDAQSGQIIMLAAGISTFGTESAAEFLFKPELFEQIVKQAPKKWESKNFEAVISTSVIGTTPSSPRLVDTYFW